MRPPQQQRILAGIAYACFLVPAALVLLGAIADIVPFRVMEPAYFGFFVLVPLALASALSIPAALILTFMVGRREPALIILSAATVLVAAGALSGVGNGSAMTAALAVYGLFVAALEARWFFFRRKSFG